MALIEQAFPFRFVFDRGLLVTDVGPSLQKLDSSFFRGRDLRDLVQLNDSNLSYEELNQHIGVPIDLVLTNTHTRMRCEFFKHGDDVVAIGSPRFDSYEDFAQSGLEISDFAAHDAASELLLLTQCKTANTEDHRSVLLKLRVAAKEQKRLAFVEQSLAHDLNAAGDVLLRIDTHDIIVEARTSRRELLPQSAKELIGRNVYESCGQIAEPLRESISLLSAAADPVPFSYELVVDGEQFYLDARITKTLNGEILVLARDVTEQRRLKLQLEHQATHDPLTDLPNRTLFTEQVKAALGRAEMVAVLFIDLDEFKLINDRHGHQLGDKVLSYVASKLKSCLGHGNTPARLGGDEFAVLLTDVESKRAAGQTAQHLINEMMKPVRIGHRNMTVSASIGIATSFDTKDLATLFQFADVAMYQAKESQKCCAVTFESHMYEKMVRRDTLQQQLLAAGRHGQFTNHYQPIIDVTSGQTRGFETLARWQHPIRGLLMPEDFMSAAEETDVIVRLGEITITNAFRDAVTWDRAGLISSIHFNVSTLQLKKTCLSTMLKDLVRDHGLSTERLTVEIKEETLQEDFNMANKEIEKLCDVGINVALDEFGAGNSSLAFLERLPFASVKLARPFVQQLGQSRQRNQLVCAVVELAQALDLEVIAVGVESTVQQNLLCRYGCTLAQGELYSPPMTSSEVRQRGTWAQAEHLLTV